MELAVLVLRDLLRYSAQLPEVARDISTNHIPGLLTSLLALKPECQLPVLEGCQACMTFYPRACGSLRVSAGRRLVRPNYASAQHGALCCAGILPTWLWEARWEESKSCLFSAPWLLTPPMPLSSPQLACECYALLPSLGAGFSQGLKYRESWEQQAHSLVATLHRLLGRLYEGAETGEWA
ncbi:hypothetical protein L345_17845, partial [Ophiophagus hannah]